jgi:tetratricopeptide (TPR) repeat protein
MILRVWKYAPISVVFLLAMTAPSAVYAQDPQLASDIYHTTVDTAVLDVYLKGPDGKPIQAAAVVTLLKLTNEFYRQETAKAGHISFSNVEATEYALQVVTPGYETATKQVETIRNETRSVTIELRQMSAEDAAEASAYNALSPKAQKEIGKALEALRANKVVDARNHLDAAERVAPHQAEVEYLYGVYLQQTGNKEQAKAHWKKAVEANPRHLHASLSLADALIRENQATEALPYLTRAVEAEPTSWRAHAILASAYLHVDSADEAVKHAERALELGHGQAATVQPVLAAALAKKGEMARAIAVLQGYMQEHPKDEEAGKLEESLQKMAAAGVTPGANVPTAEVLSVSIPSAVSLPLPSSWLPPDVDELVPAVEPGTVCKLDEVLKNAGKRVQELVKNVDRFTASEFLKHESIDKYGLAGSAETRRFDYLVSIQEMRPGLLNVEEYRGQGDVLAEFPDGIATNGLPALVLIFHPYYAGNFEMSCEGLARRSSGLAWQIHFRQNPSKPNTIRSYRLGAEGLFLSGCAERAGVDRGGQLSDPEAGNTDGRSGSADPAGGRLHGG